MKRYSFIYGYKYKRLAEFIQYLEENYNLRYIETIDLSSPISFSIPLIGFSPPNKEVIFESNPNFDKIRKCKGCNFPIESEICGNCRKDIN